MCGVLFGGEFPALELGLEGAFTGGRECMLVRRLRGWERAFKAAFVLWDELCRAGNEKDICRRGKGRTLTLE